MLDIVIPFARVSVKAATFGDRCARCSRLGVAMILRRALAISIALLMAVPAWALPSAAVGTVTNSKDTTVRGIVVPPGTTVFDGDTLDVGAHGSAWIGLAGGANVFLASGSRVQVLRPGDAGKIQVEISSGMTRFRATAQSPVEALLADAVIRPAGDSPVVGFVRMTSPTTALVGAEKGDLVITTEHDGTSVTVHEGYAINATLAPDPQRQSARSRGAGLIFLVGAAILIATIGIVIATNGSGHHGSVSPFVP